jgi:hypothetical protein
MKILMDFCGSVPAAKAAQPLTAMLMAIPGLVLGVCDAMSPVTAPWAVAAVP